MVTLKRLARKRWKVTRNPHWKSIWNSLNSRDKKRLSRLQTEQWENKLNNLDKPNHEFWALAKHFSNSRYTTATRLLDGTLSLDKSNTFANMLETQFAVNSEPYDDHIQQIHHHLLIWMNHFILLLSLHREKYNKSFVDYVVEVHQAQINFLQSPSNKYFARHWFSSSNYLTL